MSHKTLPCGKKASAYFPLVKQRQTVEAHNTGQLRATESEVLLWKCNFHTYWCSTTHFAKVLKCALMLYRGVTGVNICEQKRHSVLTWMVYLGHDLISSAVRSHYQIYELSLLEDWKAAWLISNWTTSSFLLFLSLFSIHNIHFNRDLSPLWMFSQWCFFFCLSSVWLICIWERWKPDLIILDVMELSLQSVVI